MTRAAANPPPPTMATVLASSPTAGGASELPVPLPQQAGTQWSVWIGVAVAALLVVLRVLFGPRTRKLPSGHYDKPRRLLLTGCASGMGRRLTHTLLRRGHIVFATDVNAQVRRWV